MKKVGRKVVSVLLTLCMLLTMLPVSALAADEGTVDTAPAETNLAEPVNTGNSSSDEGETPVSTLVAGTEDSVDYVDEDGQTQTCTEYTTVAAATTTWSNGWYVVTGTVTLDDRVEVSDSVNLILADGAELNATKGIGVTAGNSLTIYGQSEGTGKLTAGAYQVYNSAAIGGTDDKGQNRNLCAHGDITINGGDITATGTSSAAGIGGGGSATGTSGTITINGGTVKATGGSDAAGIGGGYANTTNGGAIIINGGTVTATGGSKAAGIGAGYSGAGGMEITIKGGTVKATGGSNDTYGGAGIGANYGGSTNPVIITITGSADVTATGGLGAAGIGGGSGKAEAAVDTIVIDGSAKVYATGGDSDTYGGAGIGAGGNGACGSITIGGSADVTATGGESEYRSGAGIGAGGFSAVDFGTMTYISNCDVIEITGGTVDATGGTGAEAVGGNEKAKVETVSISGGAFTENTFPNGEIPADYLADGYELKQDADGTWSVKEEEETPPEPTGVAQIGDKTYPTLEKAFDAVGSDAVTIKLLADTQISNNAIEVAAGENIVLDLNGCAVTVPEAVSGRSIYAISNYGTLTIRDTSAEKDGSISSRGVQNLENGILTLESGTINSIDSNGGGAAVWNEATFYMTGGTLAFTGEKSGNNSGTPLSNQFGATATITGGSLLSPYTCVFNSGHMKISNVSLAGQTAYWHVIKTYGGSDLELRNVNVSATLGGGIEAAGGTVDIYDCTFTQMGYYDWNSVNVAVSGGGTVNVHSGTFTSENYGAYVFNSGGTINVEGGTFSAGRTVLKADNSTTSNPSVINVADGAFTGKLEIGSSSTLSISGGTFSVEIPEKYCAEGFVPQENANGTWGVVAETTYVAQIGDQTYPTLEAAFAAVGSEAVTIKLLADTQISNAIEVPEGKTITLDLNGCAVTVPAAGSDGRSLYAINNKGTLTICDNSTEQDGSITARGIQNIGNGILTINSGTFISCDANGGAAVWNEATAYINGGTFKTVFVGSASDNYGPGCLNNSGTAVITAGTFESVNKRTYAVISTGTITITPAEGKEVIVSGAHGGLAVDSGVAVVNGGSFSSTEYYGLYVSNDGQGEDPMQAAVTVNGGTFTGANYSVWIGSDYNNPVNSTIAIHNGIFMKPLNAQSNTREGAVQVYGGTFYQEVPPEYCAEGFVPQKNADGTWGVVKKDEAEINGKQYATLSEALNAVKGGETIKILAPATVNMTKTYAITGKAITLDLNGQTVTWKSSAKNMIEIGTDGGLTIQDATDAGVLHFIGTGTTSYGSGIYTSGNGSLSLTGGTVLYEHSKAGYGLNITGSSTFTMTSGTVKIAGAVNYAVRLASTSQCQLNGGKILFDEGTTATTLYGVHAVLYSSAGEDAGFSLGNLTVDGSMVPDTKTVYCVYGYNDGTPVTISGGTYTANDKSASYAVGGGNSNATSISGGTFNGAVKAAIGKVTGGQFSVQPSAAYLPEGKIYELQQDGYYYVVDGTYVARLGTVGYTSWDALWKDASGGTTASAVYILADVKEITVPAGKNVTFYNSGNCAIGKITNNGTCKIISYAMTGTEVVNNGSLNLGHEVKSLVNNQGATMEATSYSYAKVTDSITNSGTMTISKGTYPCTITNTGTITLTGGSFAREVKDWCADGYTTQESGDLWVVVKNGPHVAEIDGYWYTSLSAAINAAKDGDTVKLLMDTTLTPTTTGTGLKNAITISGVSKPNLTLDLNGKTISWDQTCADQTLSSTPVMFSIIGGANITITGKGTIDTELGSNTSYGINMTTSPKNQLTIENGTFTGAPTAIQVEKGTLTILDGTFKLAKTVAEDKPEQAKYVVNAIDANWKNDSANISIQGGSFCFDPSDNPEGEGSSYVAEGFEAVVNTDGSFEIAKVKVAEVGDVQYTSLTEAINAATDGQTIKLLADSTGNTTATISNGRKLTLNMNGFDAGFIKYNNISIYHGGLNIIGSGKLYEEEPYFAPVVIYGSDDPEAADYTTVTVGKDVTLEGWSGLFIDQHDEHKETAYGIKATVNGTLHSVKDFQGYGGHALYVQGVITATEGNVPEIILDGATLNTDVGNGMYLAGYAKTTITDSTITSTGENSTGIEIRAGELTISGNTTVSGGNGEFVADPNGNGSTTNNVALAVVQHTTKLPVIVTVKGGTFNGGAALYQADQQDNGADAVAKVQISVEDGTFNGVVYSENKTNFITGGTFSEKPNEAYCAEGYAPVENDNGTWGVEVETTYVAEVNSQKYESLIDAVNVAKVSGQTVKLLANVELQPVEGKDYALLIDNGESMTLDLNGHKITATLNNTEEFNLIKNYGGLTITDDSEGQKGSIEVTENGSHDSARTSILYNGYDTGKFTLEAGTLKLTGGEGSKKPLYGVYSSGTTVVMNGGAIEVRRLNSYYEYSESWDVYGIYNSSGCQTTVNGGTITVENQGMYNSAYGIFNASGTVSIHGTPETPYIAANAFNTGIYFEHTLYGNITLYGGKYNMQTDTATGWIEGENNITIAEGYEKKFNGNRTVSIVKSPVAQIGSTKYDTLEEAVAAVKSGETITMLTDVEEGSGIIVPSGSNFTIDFAGHTYKVVGNLAGSTGTESQCFQLLRDSNITMKNGTIVANNSGIQMIIQNYANLTLDGMTLDATQGTNNVGYVMSNNCGNVTITGNTNITAKDGEVAFDVFYWPDNGYVEGVTVTVDENMTGTITGKIEYAADDTAQDADVAEKAKLNIEAGTFIGSIVTTETNHGISISGGSFSVKPDDSYLAPYYEASQNTTGDNYWTVDVAEEYEATWTNGETLEAGTLDAMLDAANAAKAGTVALLKDIAASGIHVSAGVTLDLAGHELDATGSEFTAYGKVVDSTEGEGLLKLPAEYYTIQKDNPSLPIYDSTAGGYRLYTYQLTTLRTYEPGTANTVQFWFKLTFTNEEAWELLTTGNENHGITVKSKYQFSGQTASESWFSFNSEFIHWIADQVVSSQYTQDQLGFYLNVTNTNLLGERTMTVTPAVDSVPSVGTESEQMTYSLNLGE